MIVDTHLHIDDLPALGWKLEAAECVRRMEEAEIERGVVMTIVDAPEVNPRALELVAEACAAYPGRLDAFARIHPSYGDESLALLERAFALGFKGLKLHPVSTLAHPAGEDTLRLVRAAAEHGAPTLFHCGDEPLTTPYAVARAAAACPAATIILGHMGGYFHVDEAIEVAQEHENLLLETSAMPYAAKIRGIGLCGQRPPDPGRGPLIVDSLTFVGESLFGPSTSATELLARLDEVGADRAIVCPAKPRGYDLGAANDAVAEAVALGDGRLTGVARVDPLLGDDACAELEQALGRLGLRGLFLHPWEETFRIADPCVVPIVETARRHSVPVIVAAGYPWLSEALQVGALALRFPDVTFVATNGLQLNISGLFRSTRSSPLRRRRTCSCRLPASTARTSSKASSAASEQNGSSTRVTTRCSTPGSRSGGCSGRRSATRSRRRFSAGTRHGCSA